MGLLYTWLKYNTRFISHLYFRNIRIEGLENIPKTGPVLLLPNHPNSFLDPSVLAAAMERETHFLARGDVFKHPLAAFFLRQVNILPIFRESEGKHNLTRNYATFDTVQELFEKEKVVIVFPEGQARNNWDFRALKKGPYRLVRKAWESTGKAKNVVMIPVGITYEHYFGAGNQIFIRIGEPFKKSDFMGLPNASAEVEVFFRKLHETIPELAYIHPEMGPEHEDFDAFRHALQNGGSYHGDLPSILQKARTAKGSDQRPANGNWIKYTGIFLPLDLFSRWLAKKIIHDFHFHDAIRFALFLLLWPFYLAALGLLLNQLISAI